MSSLVYPTRCTDRQCPYNIWMYGGGPVPRQIDVQYWNTVLNTNRGKTDKPALPDPLPLPNMWSDPKLHFISWFKSRLRRSSSHSSLSTCYTDIRLPVDPYSPHAFTLNMNDQCGTKTQEIHQVRSRYYDKIYFLSNNQT